MSGRDPAQMFRQAPSRPGRLPWGSASVLVLLCALGASTAQGACSVDAAAGNDANMCCTTAMPCKTIQAAITQAMAGDTINVAAGMYPETFCSGGPDNGMPCADNGGCTAPGICQAFLNINKTLTLRGANAGVDARGPRGPESIVTDFRGTGVGADNVVIDGFTFQGSVVSGLLGFGIQLQPGSSGATIVNNIFQNNIIGLGIANDDAAHQLVVRHNLFQNNNQPGAASGTGIYTDQFVGGPVVTNVLIEENDFKLNNNSGIDLSNTCPDAAMPVAPCLATGNGVFNIEVRNNTFDMNGRAFDIFNTHGLNFHDNDVTDSTLSMSAALRIFDGNSDITIVRNNLSNNVMGVADGIHLSVILGDLLGPSSKVEIHLNNITPFERDGLLVDAMSTSDTVNATCNWWGSVTGPTNPANPGGTGEPVVGDAIFDCWLIGLAPDAPCCFPTPTATPTVTSTATATNTPPPLPNGGECSTPEQCESMHCVDGVCCDQPCTGPNEICNLPGREGTCLTTAAAPAPALSEAAKLVALGVLLLIAGLGLWRRRFG